MRRILSFFLLMSLVFAFFGCDGKCIGEIHGPEWDTVVIGDTEYHRDYHSDISISDKGKYLGTVTDGKNSFSVFTVKGDDDGNYIYCFWDWEGMIYSKEDNK